MMNRLVLTYGTFDLFHVGHVRLLERLRSFGDRLVVGLSTDEFNESKGKTSIFPYAQRHEIVSSCRFVDAVFPEQSWDQKRDDIARLGAETLGMGDDWAGAFDHLSDICRVVYVPRTEGISTTGVRDVIRSVYATERRTVHSLAQQIVEILSDRPHHVG